MGDILIHFGSKMPGLTGASTGTTSCLYAFIGVEAVIVAAGEARRPRHDLPQASRRMYLWTIALYVISVFLVSLNISCTDPQLRPLLAESDSSGQYSPFIIVIENARLEGGDALKWVVTVGIAGAIWTAA